MAFILYVFGVLLCPLFFFLNAGASVRTREKEPSARTGDCNLQFSGT